VQKENTPVRYLQTGPPEVFPASRASFCPVRPWRKPLLYQTGTFFLPIIPQEYRVRHPAQEGSPLVGGSKNTHSHCTSNTSSI